MDQERLALAIGIGLVVNLAFGETFGIAAGGMVVPGYLALTLTRPVDLALTLGSGFVAFAIVRALSPFMIIFGRRRTVLMILCGYVVGLLVTSIGLPSIAGEGSKLAAEAGVVGYIIPGLIAIWLDRQGVVQTLGAMTTATIVVRLILTLVAGSGETL